jgi:hypothetical protein
MKGNACLKPASSKIAIKRKAANKAQGQAASRVLPAAESQWEEKFSVFLGESGKGDFPMLRLRCQRQHFGLRRSHV